MLQSIHDKAKGWIAYAIVGIITVAFALFGINQYFEGGSSVAAAVVNGEDIPVQTVQNALLQLKQQVGGQLPAEMEAALKENALESVITRTLIEQKVKAAGYRASDVEVAQAIANIPVFQKDGKFDQATYENFLKMQQRNPAEFEEQVRADLSQQQLQDAVQSTAFLPKNAITQYQALREQQRELELFTLKVADFEKQVSVSDEQIAQYYEQNKANYMTDAKVQLAYVELKRDALAAAVSVDEAALKTWFEENASRYAEPEKRAVSHILVKVDDPAKNGEAKKRIDALYAELKEGKRTFEAIASSDSDDKVAAEKQGRLGDIVAGDWGPAFEKAVFALAAGQVSEPVKTEAGYEILRVDSITPAKPRTFEQARADAEKDYRNEQADKAFLEKSDLLGRLIYEQDGDLAPAAQAVGLSVQQTGWLTRLQGEGIGANQKVRDAAFSDAVLQSGKNSELIELADGHAVAIRVVNHEAAAQKPLEQVRDEVRTTLVAQEARKLATQKGEELLKQLREAKAWSALTSSGLGAEAAVEKLGFIGRTDGKLAPEVLQQAFAMTQPSDGQATWSGVVQSNGDYTVIALKAVKAGQVAELTADAQALYQQTLGARELGAFLQNLRESAKVVTHPENL